MILNFKTNQSSSNQINETNTKDLLKFQTISIPKSSLQMRCVFSMGGFLLIRGVEMVVQLNAPGLHLCPPHSTTGMGYSISLRGVSYDSCDTVFSGKGTTIF